MQHPTDRFAGLRSALKPIHPDGWRFIAIAAAVAFVLFFIWQPLGWLGVAATLWVASFFRDPWRVSPQTPGLALAPADGEIVAVDTAMPPAELEMNSGPMLRIAIFMNLLDVHINRAALAGRVVKIAHRDGSYRDARDPESSEANERNGIRIAAPGGDVALVQIAGRIARRIRCDLIEGQDVIAGQRIGLIRFGSRAELYLPNEWRALVAVGQRTVGGETVLAATAEAATAPRTATVTH